MASHLMIVPKNKNVTAGDLRRLMMYMAKSPAHAWFDSRTLWPRTKYYVVGHLIHGVDEVKDTVDKWIATRGMKSNQRPSVVGQELLVFHESEWMPNARFHIGIGAFDQVRLHRHDYTERLLKEARESAEPVEIVTYADGIEEVALWASPGRKAFVATHKGSEIGFVPFASNLTAVVGWFYGKIRDIEKERI